MQSTPENQRRLSQKDFPEETRDGLCQNRQKSARANRSIFGGTFFWLREGGAPFYCRDALRDSGAAIGAVDRGIAGLKRKGLGQEECRTPVATIGAMVVMRTADQEASADGSGPD